MAALTKDRDTLERDGREFDFPVAGVARIFAGSLVVLNATAYAEPGWTATGKMAAGVAQEHVDNREGADGDATVRVRRGVFRFANSAAADAIALTEVGQTCYIVDDQTVAKTNGGGTRSPAGIIHDVDARGVWVLIGYGPAAADGGLLAANNLSDLANAATARTALDVYAKAAVLAVANDLSDLSDPVAARGNLGVNKAYVPVVVADLRAATGAVLRFVAPVAGDLTALRSVLADALAAGDATVTLAINGVDVTDGVLTIAQAGSATGDVDAAAPSAANTVAVGDIVTLTVAGANTAQVGADLMVEITF